MTSVVEKLLEHFNEKELQNTNQQEFKIKIKEKKR